MENKTNLTALEKLAPVLNTTAEELAVIQNTVAKGTTPMELAYFLKVSQSTGLSPYNKEVWCYKDHKGNLIIFTGRDGFLKIAQMSGEFGGIRSAEVRENDEFGLDIPNGKVHHIVKGSSTKDRGRIVAGWAIVWRKNCEPTIEVCEFDVYNRNFGTWKTHPAEMIKKCAEAKALKKAFGITGMQPETEFETEDGVAVPIGTEFATDSKIRYIERLLFSSTINDERRDAIEAMITENLTLDQADELVRELKDAQPDAIDSGGNYGQKEIHAKLDAMGL